MYGNRGKEILADRKLSESSKMLRKKYPKGSLKPKTKALESMKKGSQKALDRSNQSKFVKHELTKEP